MALYIKPPSGFVSFNKFYTYVMKRLVFLYRINGHSVDEITKIIERETLAENSECLIEGTAKDKISHFTLRLLCASDSVLQDFLIQSETKFFTYRLQFYDFLKLRQMLQKGCEQSKAILLNNVYILNPYKRVLMSLIFVSEEVHNVIKEKKNSINVPFASALKFVKERLYPLHLGYVNLPLKDLKSFLILLFHELLVQGINQMRVSLCMKELDDPRMQYMLQKIKKWLHSKLSYPAIRNGKKFISGHNLMDESKKFPLCMNNLFNQLLSQHRLKHTSRIQFTLFLKEIGVPCSDVIRLFMKEYSMPLSETCEAAHGHCSHNWSDNEKRYVYSIEHLYGMRGACKVYKAHNCQSLQSTYSSDGGCPFVTFDDQHLQKTLENQTLKVKDIEDIISKVHQKKYDEACCSYLHFKVNLHCNVKKCGETEQSRCITSDLDISKNVISLTEKYRQNHGLLSSLPQKIICPSDFYSILSSYVDNNFSECLNS